MQPRTQKVKKTACRALALIDNPNIPTATVDEGVLVVNGEPVRTGYTVDKVIATFPKKVVFSVLVKNEDDEPNGKVDLYIYNSVDDTFKKVAADLNLTGKEYKVNDIRIQKYVNTYTVKVEKELPDGTKEEVEELRLEKAGLVKISKDGWVGTQDTQRDYSNRYDYNDCDDCDDYDDCDDCDDCDDYDDCDCGCNTAYGCSGADMGEIIDVTPFGKQYAVVITVATQEVVDGKVLPIEDACDVRMYLVSDTEITPAGLERMPGEFVSATIAASDRRHMNAVIKSTKKIHVDMCGRTYNITDKYAIRDLAGYEYVISTAHKDGTVEIGFCDKDTNEKYYQTAKSKDDRGDIVKVVGKSILD
jgi:hypothetical protein